MEIVYYFPNNTSIFDVMSNEILLIKTEIKNHILNVAQHLNEV